MFFCNAVTGFICFPRVVTLATCGEPPGGIAVAIAKMMWLNLDILKLLIQLTIVTLLNFNMIKKCEDEINSSSFIL